MFNYCFSFLITSVVFLANFEDFVKPVEAYVLPVPTFQVLQPQGIRISIPREFKNYIALFKIDFGVLSQGFV